MLYINMPTVLIVAGNKADYLAVQKKLKKYNTSRVRKFRTRFCFLPILLGKFF